MKTSWVLSVCPIGTDLLVPHLLNYLHCRLVKLIKPLFKVSRAEVFIFF